MKSPYLHFLKQSTAAVRATLRNVRHQVPTLALAGVASLTLFTSCLEDAVPTTGYTQEQLNTSPKAKEGAFWAIPSNHCVAWRQPLAVRLGILDAYSRRDDGRHDQSLSSLRPL